MSERFSIIDDRLALAGVLGALGIAAGSALPWAVVPTVVGVVTESGLESNGKLALIVGVLGLVFLVASLRVAGRDLPVAAALCAVASGAIAGVYLHDVRASSARVLARLLEGRGTLDPGALQSGFLARPGAGVWVVLAGSAALLISALGMLRRDRAPARA